MGTKSARPSESENALRARPSIMRLWLIFAAQRPPGALQTSPPSACYGSAWGIAPGCARIGREIQLHPSSYLYDMIW